MANKKIVVLKLRELIYTGIFLFFGAILILLLIAMFSAKHPEKNTPKQEPASEEASKEPDVSESGSFTQTFRPGIYTTDLTLSGKTFTLQLLADADRIRSIDLLCLDAADGFLGEEYITTMYPLMDPALTVLSECLSAGIPLSDITFGVESQYTGSLLKEAMEVLLEKAVTVSETAD